MGADSGHTADTTSRLTCQRIVRALIEKNRWALLSDDELVERVLGSIESGISPTEAKRLAKHHYSIAMYEACRQARDQDRREQGYHELSHYLFRVACRQWPELAEDASQRALVLVYEQIDRCRSPGTFLAFALGKLRHAFKQEHGASSREVPLEEAGRSIAQPDKTEAWTHLDYQEWCQKLLDAIQCLPSDLERKSITLKFIGGLSDAEIGERLGITANYVRVLRHRGIKRLRKDKSLIEYFEGTNGEQGKAKAPVVTFDARSPL